MNLMHTKFLLAIIKFSAPVLLMLAAGSAHALFKCVDEKGVTYYGDTMPPQCAKKPVVEMSLQGSVVRKFEAPLTPEQLKAIDDDKVRNKDKTDRMAVQKLRDNALMSTYGAEREFDVARDKEIANLEARRKTLAARSVDVDKDLIKLNNDMEFYQAGKKKTAKTKEAPPQLARDQRRASHEADSLRVELEKIDQGKSEIRTRYDAEKAHWTQLKAGMPAGTLLDEQGKVAVAPESRSQSADRSQAVAGRSKGVATCGGKVQECPLGMNFSCRGPNVGGPGVNVAAVKCVENRR